VCVVALSFQIPIRDQIVPTATITALIPDPSSAQAGDGVLETGDA